MHEVLLALVDDFCAPWPVQMLVVDDDDDEGEDVEATEAVASEQGLVLEVVSEQTLVDSVAVLPGSMVSVIVRVTTVASVAVMVEAAVLSSPVSVPMVSSGETEDSVVRVVAVAVSVSSFVSVRVRVPVATKGAVVELLMIAVEKTVSTVRVRTDVTV